MDGSMESMKKHIKENINELINKEKLQEAEVLLKEFFSMVKDDAEAFSMKSVLLILKGELEEAEIVIKEGLNYNKDNFDLNYNLAYIYETQGRYNQALLCYTIAINNCEDDNLKLGIEENISRLKNEHGAKIITTKAKIAFFVKQAMDSFLGDIISGLSDEYDVKKIVVTEYPQIEEGMRWADICWFEWCDELIAYGSKLELAREKKIICRIHGYEVYGDLIKNTNWQNVNDLIIVAPHIRKLFEKNTSELNKDNLRIHTVFCGVNVDKYPLNIKSKGYNLGYLGYINFKKNIPLTLDIFKKLYDKDRKYKLYLAGEFQDYRTMEYFKYFIKEHSLESNVFFDGWKNEHEKINWFKKIDYMVISSIDEGLCFAAAESMCSGIKPILHNCEGIKDHYDQKYIFNSIDEALEMIESPQYNSEQYRQYIKENYSLEKEKYKIINIINELDREIIKPGNPLVTIGVINYNNIAYIDDCINSIIKQNYPNIEIIIVDDFSNDGCIEKIKKYEKQYIQIKGIYHKTNKGNGTYACREIIRESNGEYFIFIASDDYLPNNNVISDYVINFRNDVNLDYVYGNLIIVDKNKKNINKWKYKQFKNNQVVENTFKRMGSGLLTMTGMFKKSFYKKNKIEWEVPNDNKVAPDTLNSLILIKNNPKIYFMDKSILCYRQHNTNSTLNYKERILSTISVIEYIINNFSEEIYYPEIEWKNMEIKLRESTKWFFISKHYCDMLEFYYNSWKPFGRDVLLTNESKKNYLKPIIDKVYYYTNKTTNISEIYNENINEILRVTDSYIE